jgi:hypothetical protein
MFKPQCPAHPTSANICLTQLIRGVRTALWYQRFLKGEPKRYLRLQKGFVEERKMFMKTLGVLAGVLAPKTRKRTAVRLRVEQLGDRVVPTVTTVHQTTFSFDQIHENLSATEMRAALEEVIESTHPKAGIACMQIRLDPGHVAAVELWKRYPDGTLALLGYETVKPRARWVGIVPLVNPDYDSSKEGAGWKRRVHTGEPGGLVLELHVRLRDGAGAESPFNLRFLKHTITYPGHKYLTTVSSFTYNGYVQPPQPPSGSTEIGISAEFQHVLAAGDNLELADLYIYRLDTERLVTLDLTFTGTAPVDLDLRCRDDNGNETGPALGSFSVVGNHLYITLDLSFNGTLVLDLDGDTFGAFQFTNVRGYIAA